MHANRFGSAFARARKARALLLPLALLFAAPAHADALDNVLDVMHTAGVVDGNLKDAKPLIECLAKGNDVPQCAAGSVQDAELAGDPQVANVVGVYQAYRDHDWLLVLKRAGLTVGCALVPGGEAKDLACGELGRIANEVVGGIGSALGAIGDFVESVFSSGDDPEPMSEQDYYRLNFEPWLHKSVIAQLDQDTPANVQVLGAPMPACVDYFSHHRYSGAQAADACGRMRKNLADTGWQLGNAFRQESDSYFQLHFAPKVEEWAAMSFGNQNIGIYAHQAVNICVDDERKHVSLPPPGFEQCAAIETSVANLFGGAMDDLQKDLAQQVKAKCLAQAQARAVSPADDAYTRVCNPVGNQVTWKVLAAMKAQKDRMDIAFTAGCPNNGTPKSVHCDSIAAQSACQKALPGHASMCVLDAAGNVQTQLNYIYASVDAPDARCKVTGPNWTLIQCPHTMQVFRCNGLKKSIADEHGAQAVGDIACETRPDPAYDAMRAVAAQVVDALNADYGGPAPAEPCATERHDPLAVWCPPTFDWAAVPERAAAVNGLLYAVEANGRPKSMACPEDEDNDGAESPCLDMAEPVHGLTPLQPVQPIQPAPAIRVRPRPVIRTEGGGGG